MPEIIDVRSVKFELFILVDYLDGKLVWDKEVLFESCSGDSANRSELYSVLIELADRLCSKASLYRQVCYLYYWPFIYRKFERTNKLLSLEF